MHICITQTQWINWWGPEQNGFYFADNIWKCILFNEYVDFDGNTNEVPSWIFDLQNVSIGSVTEFGAEQATSWYLNQCWPICVLLYGITLLKWVNSLVYDSNYTPLHNKVVGVILVSLCPSVRPSIPHLVSAPQHLQFWLNPFHIFTNYQSTSEGVSHIKFLAKFQNLNSWQFF